MKNKVFVITGGSSGIGAASARLIAETGTLVALLDVDENNGQAIAAEITSTGGKCAFFQTDMIRWEAVIAARYLVETRLGPIDTWINIAGGSGRKFGDGPIHECSESAWDATLDLNLRTTYHGCKAAIQSMLPKRNGVIVNVSSVLGLVGGDQDFATHAYAASKGAIISLTRSIAAYYAPMGIRANVVCPGLIATPMSQRAQENQAIRDRLADLQPLTADFGSPEDIAQAILYLASDASRFVTGAVLTVDGGWTAR